jgi:hypothetical protein
MHIAVSGWQIKIHGNPLIKMSKGIFHNMRVLFLQGFCA